MTTEGIDFVISQQLEITKAHKTESQRKEYFCVTIKSINYNDT